MSLLDPKRWQTNYVANGCAPWIPLQLVFFGKSSSACKIRYFNVCYIMNAMWMKPMERWSDATTTTKKMSSQCRPQNYPAIIAFHSLCNFGLHVCVPIEELLNNSTEEKKTQKNLMIARLNVTRLIKIVTHTNGLAPLVLFNFFFSIFGSVWFKLLPLGCGYATERRRFDGKRTKNTFGGHHFQCATGTIDQDVHFESELDKIPNNSNC